MMTVTASLEESKQQWSARKGKGGRGGRVEGGRKEGEP